MKDKISNVTECPNCGENSVKFRDDTQLFPFDSDGKLIELSAVVPVGHCENCGIDFTDERGEVLRHEAVCAHLGIFSPREIVAIRKRLNLTRSAMAEITKIGEASLARWERGVGIQNGAMDQLLYLLSKEGNLNRLRARNCQAEVDQGPKPASSALIYRFPHLKGRLEAAEAEAKGFTLNVKTG